MRPFDVVLVGEILVELYSGEPLTDGAGLRLGFSGDVLNAAAAAAAAGARTAVLTSIGDDELGAAILARVAALGIDTSLIRRTSAGNGAYMLHGDLSGQSQFTYWRTGSAASKMTAADVYQQQDVLARAGAVVLSGIFSALSPGCAEATLAAARIAADSGAAVIYDPNFRPRLTTPTRAHDALAQIAPYCTVVTPSCPGDSRPLLGTADPYEAAAAVRALGAGAVALTCGSQPLVVSSADGEFTVPVPHNPDAVDATGAGDVFAGTLAARLALGDRLPEAASLGVGAASLSVAGRGGTGHIPTLGDTRSIAPAVPA
ncbi:MAG TPA: sugar kinase [Streptosporangiaceae bacterium]